MKYKFCSIRINVTKYDVTFTTKGEFLPLPPPVATLLDYVIKFLRRNRISNIFCFIGRGLWNLDLFFSNKTKGRILGILL